MKSFFMLLVCSMVFQACSSSHFVSSSSGDLTLAEFNELAGSQAARIVFLNDSTAEAQKVVAGSDSISWFDPTTRKQIHTATSSVKMITFADLTFRGAEYGLLIGASIGLISAVTAHDSHFYPSWFPPVCFGGLGLLVGWVVAPTSANRDNYHIGYSQLEDVSREISVSMSAANTDLIYLNNGSIVRGSVVEMLVEQSSSSKSMLHLRSFTIYSRMINLAFNGGDHLKHLTVRVQGGKEITFESSQILRIELTE